MIKHIRPLFKSNSNFSILFSFRLFIGSTSRFCVENAPCSVVCVKLPGGHTDAPGETSLSQAQKDTSTHQSTVQHGDHTHERFMVVD